MILGAGIFRYRAWEFCVELVQIIAKDTAPIIALSSLTVL